MKTLGFLTLLYGSEYLDAAIRSVYNNVDAILIAYTPEPSHQKGRIDNPDTEVLLYSIAKKADPDNKIIWQKGTYTNEGQHRQAGIEYGKANGYDVLVGFDADEIYYKENLSILIRDCYESKVDKYRIKMSHFWRSFNHICRDDMFQIRLRYLGEPSVDERYSQHYCDVAHMGYAIPSAKVQMKLKIHGHRSEIPREWFVDTFLKWERVSHGLHPTSKELWFPEPFDKEGLPEALWGHPFWNLDLIP